MKKSLLLAWVVVFIALPFLASAQGRQISGTVSNEKGAFTIAIQNANAVLVISHAGMKEQEIQVGASNSYNVSLNDNGTLSEVVITALGITRKDRSLGYATQQVKGENLTLTREQNVIGSLAGKIAGVQVTGASGASMGGTQKIKIRGVNSIGGGEEPLLVV